MISRASGVYSITNIATGKRYIGSSVSIRARANEHKRILEKNQHHSVKLQRSWNKHGSSNFVFAVEILCSSKDLILYEQIAIDAYNSYRHGYNSVPKAGNHLGAKRSVQACMNISNGKMGHKHSEETKRKLSEAHKGRGLGEKKPFRERRPMSEETKAKIAASISSMTRKKPKPMSDETKAKLSLALRGNNNRAKNLHAQ